MIAGELIRQAQASEIELRLVGGKVKAIGPREAVARLIEPLRQYREALTHALQFELQEVLPVTSPAYAMPEPIDWHALDAAYLAHHFNCPTCIAAGRGSRYGLRCGSRAALWRAYQRLQTAPDVPTNQALAGMAAPLGLVMGHGPTRAHPLFSEGASTLR